MASLAALPMYDFDEIAGALDELWSAVGGYLQVSGVAGVPVGLDHVMAYDATWSDPTLLLGQSCGLPIVDQLDGRVHVVGAFAVGPASGGSDDDAPMYSSALVVRRDTSVDRLSRLPWGDGVRVAINGWNSLSGYVSLGAACAAAVAADAMSADAAFGSVAVTGAHVHSLAAVSDGTADLACIDGHTFALLSRYRPEAVEGVRVIGRGPIIPCVPLITNLSTSPEVVVALRAALSSVTTDAALAGVRAHLGITGFVPLDNGDYEPVRTLHAVAKRFFARTLRTDFPAKSVTENHPIEPPNR